MPSCPHPKPPLLLPNVLLSKQLLGDGLIIQINTDEVTCLQMAVSNDGFLTVQMDHKPQDQIMLLARGFILKKKKVIHHTGMIRR